MDLEHVEMVKYPASDAVIAVLLAANRAICGDRAFGS
jgi:hypothetical protein